MTDVTVTFTGPLFDGRAEKILDAHTDRAEQDVALMGRDLVRARVGREAQHSTGRFASRTVVDRSSGDGFQVHTPGLRYGAWLEGTSRRNARSSFKGHHLYREARQETEARAPAITAQAADRAVKEING